MIQGRREVRQPRSAGEISVDPGANRTGFIESAGEPGLHDHCHLLPSYSPDLNPIERVWWHLHENITRNHRCKDLTELLDQVFAWLGARNPFEIEGSVYPKAKAA